MSPFLRSHPFPVEAFFETSLVLTYAVPFQRLQPLIPPCCTLDTYENEWAFLAVAMVRTKHLRPRGFPQWLGSDFFLVGYRVFVRYRNTSGRVMRGLYILGSETDSSVMRSLGNVFTTYAYTKIDLSVKQQGEMLEISSHDGGIHVVADVSDRANVPLPPGSPFQDHRTARRYQGPLPFTFSYDDRSGEVLIVKGVRSGWDPTPIHVIEHSFERLEQLHIPEMRLASATFLENIPYRWERGKKERWIK